MKCEFKSHLAYQNVRMNKMGGKWCDGNNQCLYSKYIECETHKGCERCSWNPAVSNMVKEIRLLKCKLKEKEEKRK